MPNVPVGPNRRAEPHAGFHQFADRGPIPTGEALEVEQQHSLQRCDSLRLRDLLGKMKEATQPTAGLRQLFQLLLCQSATLPAFPDVHRSDPPQLRSLLKICHSVIYHEICYTVSLKSAPLQSFRKERLLARAREEKAVRRRFPVSTGVSFNA